MRKEKVRNTLRKLRTSAGYVLIFLTAVLFYKYISENPDLLDSLGSISILVLPVLLVIYGVFLLTNFFVTYATIKLCDKDFPKLQSFMLTIYSTLVNFFGPLQSGPGFRAIYLKKKIDLSVLQYTKATMVYYIFFGLISVAMILSAVSVLLSLLALLTIPIIIYALNKRGSLGDLKSKWLTGVFFVTAAQLMIVSLMYAIELNSIGANPDIVSLLAYTGSANLALFVAFTPAAIGIRESFLVFSQSLHNIPTEQIVAANVIDRTVYVVFLLILFAFSASMHLKEKLLQKPA